jgi:hypothetical protein
MSNSVSVSYRMFIRDSNTGETELFLVKYNDGKQVQLIEIGEGADDYHMGSVLPEDANCLGTVKGVSDKTMTLINDAGTEMNIPTDEKMIWIVKGLLSGQMGVAVRENRRIMFALPVDRARYIGDKKNDEAEWNAVLDLFPKATRAPWKGYKDNVFEMEAAVATRKKKRNF